MIDINDSEFLSRIEPKELLDKVCDGKTAAAMIQPGDILGISGFTPCGYPKITMHELAERMKQTPFQVCLDGCFHRFPDRYRTGGSKRYQKPYALSDKRQSEKSNQCRPDQLFRPASQPCGTADP